MSTTETTGPTSTGPTPRGPTPRGVAEDGTPTTDVAHSDVEHEHPSDGKYVQIALILAVLTGFEVATYYVEDQLGPALIPILMVMMVVKFVIVGAWFMHLRFDSKLLTRLFYAGLILAVVVYVAALATFGFWAS
ncbi:hypothetical protein BH24ACT3_BH24ACT3_02130 [soil metagenome]